VLRVDDDVFVFLDDVDDVQLDAELLRGPQRVVAFRHRALVMANSVSVSLHAEAGIEIDALDVNALFQDEPGGEHGVQSARNQRHGFFRCGGCRGLAEIDSW